MCKVKSPTHLQKNYHLITNSFKQLVKTMVITEPTTTKFEISKPSKSILNIYKRNNVFVVMVTVLPRRNHAIF